MPCRYCEKRHPACHDTCEDYQAEKACHDERKKTIRKNKHAEADYVGFVTEGMTRFGHVRKKKREV